MKTAEQLYAMPDDGHRYELIQGELIVMSPAGGRHGRIALRINKLLAIHVDDNGLGTTFAAETGFRIASSPDTVRAPDGAFVEKSKMDSLQDDSGYLPFAPDLAIEVVSPNDSFASVEEKAFTWLRHGSRLVLILEPQSETLHAYRSRNQIEVFNSGESLDVSDVVTGWKLDVDSIYR